jgi:hypothetical protein
MLHALRPAPGRGSFRIVDEVTSVRMLAQGHFHAQELDASLAPENRVDM